jgi:hypothetical protein
MRKHVLFLLSCISGAAIQLMAAPAPAEAAIRSVPGQRCSIDKQSYTAIEFRNSGLANTTSNEIYTTCGLLLDDELPSEDISYLEVNGNDPKTFAQVQAFACVTYYGQQGGYCYTGVGSGVAYTGRYYLAPPLNAFQTYPFDYAHVFLLVPTGSTVAGLWYVD